jgi:hypothetical protein
MGCPTWDAPHGWEAYEWLKCKTNGMPLNLSFTVHVCAALYWGGQTFTSTARQTRRAHGCDPWRTGSDADRQHDVAARRSLDAFPANVDHQKWGGPMDTMDKAASPRSVGGSDGHGRKVHHSRAKDGGPAMHYLRQLNRSDTDWRETNRHRLCHHMRTVCKERGDHQMNPVPQPYVTTGGP